MRKVSTLFLIGAVALVGLFTPKSVEAAPIFARQVGVPCKACHFQHLPKLNAFGREFKLGGMTQASVDLIEDEGLSIPAVANVGVVVKTRYRKQENKTSSAVKTGTERGVLDLPDEVALFVGGRMGTDWGFYSEGLSAGSGSNKIVYSHAFDGFQGGVTVFMTDGGGPSFGMELMNSANRFNRGWERREKAYAQHAIGGPASGNGSGVGLFAGNSIAFANVSFFAPTYGADADANTDLATYYRLILTPQIIQDASFMIGVQGTAGSFKAADSVSSATVVETATESTAIDLQIQTEVSAMELEVAAAYITNPSGSATKANLWNSSTSNDEKAWNVDVQLSAFHHGGIKVSYLDVVDDGNNESYKATGFGAWYEFAQNIELVVEYFSFDDNRTSGALDSYLCLMLEIGA